MWSKLFSRAIRPIRMIWYAAISCTFLRQASGCGDGHRAARTAWLARPVTLLIFKIQFRNSARPVFAPKNFLRPRRNTPVFRTTGMIRGLEANQTPRFCNDFLAFSIFCRAENLKSCLFHDDKVSPIGACLSGMASYHSTNSRRNFARVNG